jgi:hypothetical protein
VPEICKKLLNFENGIALLTPKSRLHSVPRILRLVSSELAIKKIPSTPGRTQTESFSTSIAKLILTNGIMMKKEKSYRDA